MTDPILKKAMEKRDEAMREVERWEEWIKAYVELSDPSLDLDIPQSRRGPSLVEKTDIAADSASLLTSPPESSGRSSNGNGTWPRT
jgi:hypothetical protein